MQARQPNGVNVIATEPKAEGTDGALLWELGNLLAKQERRLMIRFVAPQRAAT